MLLDGSPSSAFPLPEGWVVCERVDDVIDADGIALHRCGIAAGSGDEQAVGSAADFDAPPTLRSHFELLERIALQQAARGKGHSVVVRGLRGDVVERVAVQDVFPPSPEPERWVYARSSGVALHSDWKRACEKAELELVERDRVQRSWLGEVAPRSILVDRHASPLARTQSYDWRAAVFPASPRADFGAGIEVVGIFGFPRTHEAPLVMGYGAARSLDQAFAAAVREASQSLAFLWGEPIPDEAPPPRPNPLAHLERFQVRAMHAVLARWLDGEHTRSRSSSTSIRRGDATVRWADLTPPWMTGGLRVAKALSPAALPLTFGTSRFFEHLPEELRLHPIP